MIEHDHDQVPDFCDHCRHALQIIAVQFKLLRVRAVLACSSCALAYVEPERRARLSTATRA